LNVVSVAETAELLLAGRVPNVESKRTSISVKDKRVDFDAQRGDVFLLEFTGQVALHERGLSDSTVADEHQFESRHFLFSGRHLSIFNLEETSSILASFCDVRRL
jgi:hypothetical protein